MHRNRTWRAALILLPMLFHVCPRATGQQATGPEEATPSIEVHVNRVFVPVVVRDKQGRALGDLKKEDFQVWDNGKPRPVAAFSVESNQAIGNNPANGHPAPDAATPGLPPRRTVVFLFDDMHLNVTDLAYARKSALKAVAEWLTATDIAAVVSTSGRTNSGLTRDRAGLQEAIMSVQVHSLYRSDAAECPKLDYYQADLMENKHDSGATGDAIRQVFNCNPGLDPKKDVDMAERQAEVTARRVLMVGDQDAMSTYATTREIIRRMAGLPGERLLILVSPGFLTLAPEALTAESQMIDFAAQSNVIVSAIDARGLYTTQLNASEKSPSLQDMNGSGGSVQQQGDYRRSSMLAAKDTMASLADGTGGTFFHNSNDLDAGFNLLTAVPASVYVLELSFDDAKPGYHRLHVKVDRDGIEVQSRRGYFVPRPAKHKK